MMKDRYFANIVPARVAAAVLAFALIGALVVHFHQLRLADARLGELQNLTARQRLQLQTLDAQTNAITAQLHAVQSENRQLQQIMGIHPRQTAARRRRTLQKMMRIGSRELGNPELVKVQTRLTTLALASADTTDEAARLRRLTLRILDVRHLQQMARATMLASIPSINPTANAAVVGCYCYRSSPTAEFHTGVDLDANYGDVVRASAAGTVAASDYDGAFGLKIDIDHGNGYHTWYAHLSRADVRPGERVVKGQPIALVGSTGRATGPHLHYQVMLNGHPIDPQPFLRGIPPQVLASLP